ncbi:hypothetical protein IG631_09517 [Alternaria alternata]|nr:hypothetical protein IG631_09517 [Alternaria alternata]
MATIRCIFRRYSYLYMMTNTRKQNNSRSHASSQSRCRQACRSPVCLRALCLFPAQARVRWGRFTRRPSNSANDMPDKADCAAIHAPAPMGSDRVALVAFC